MKRAELRRQGARFLLVGGLNVAMSYGVFILLGLFLPAWIAYTVGYTAGLIVVTALTPRFVFGARGGPLRIAVFVSFYIVLYVIGRMIVALIAPAGLLDLLFTSGLLLAVTVPLNFLAGRFLFRTPKEHLDLGKAR